MILYLGIFDRAAPVYRCGYSHTLKFNLNTGPRKVNNNSKPPISWFNPPFSLNVVKVSYRALPNIKAKIARYNAKILKNSEKAKRPTPTCNCRNKQDCPIPGKCNQSGVIYQATVTNTRGQEKNYIGLASNFKSRFYKHKASME